MLRHFNLGRSFKLRWCRAGDLFGSQIPVTTGVFELRISGIRSQFRMQESRSSNPPVVTGICDPNKSGARHHRYMTLERKIHGHERRSTLDHWL